MVLGLNGGGLLSVRGRGDIGVEYASFGRLKLTVLNGGEDPLSLKLLGFVTMLKSLAITPLVWIEALLVKGVVDFVLTTDTTLKSAIIFGVIPLLLLRIPLACFVLLLRDRSGEERVWKSLAKEPVGSGEVGTFGVVGKEGSRMKGWEE